MVDRVSFRFSLTLVLNLFPVALAAGEGFETIVANGPSSNRVDMAFVGDGYTQANLDAGTYQNHVAGFLDYMFGGSLFADPFYRYRNYFNIHRIDVISNEAGADQGPNGIFRDTALDARYYSGGTERSLTINVLKAEIALQTAIEGEDISVEMRLATVNDTKYGGTGGTYAVYSGGNASAHEIALHELGHSFADLADEYGGVGYYTGSEPTEPNVTTDPTGSKWDHWLGYNQLGIGVINAYEGGRYHDEGIYRPSFDSKMRSLGGPFDAVSREQIILNIYEHVDPLDFWTPNLDLLTDPTLLSVTPVDDDTIDIQWLLDGIALALPDLTSLDIASLNLVPGEYELTARAFDPTGFDPVNGWVRIGQEGLEQFVHWNIQITAVPEASSMILAGIGLAAVATVRRWKR